jgi:hypothetical protein
MSEIRLMTKVEWLRGLRNRYKTLINDLIINYITSDNIPNDRVKVVKKMKGQIKAINKQIKEILYK